MISRDDREIGGSGITFAYLTFVLLSWCQIVLEVQVHGGICRFSGCDNGRAGKINLWLLLIHSQHVLIVVDGLRYDLPLPEEARGPGSLAVENEARCVLILVFASFLARAI